MQSPYDANFDIVILGKVGFCDIIFSLNRGTPNSCEVNSNIGTLLEYCETSNCLLLTPINMMQGNDVYNNIVY